MRFIGIIETILLFVFFYKSKQVRLIILNSQNVLIFLSQKVSCFPIYNPTAIDRGFIDHCLIILHQYERKCQCIFDPRWWSKEQSVIRVLLRTNLPVHYHGIQSRLPFLVRAPVGAHRPPTLISLALTTPTDNGVNGTSVVQ